MRTYTKIQIAKISSDKCGVSIPDSWIGIDPVLPLLEHMRKDGAIILIKWDGERSADQGPYTAVVQGQPLGQDFFRIDAATLEAALCHIIGHYSDHVWK